MQGSKSYLDKYTDTPGVLMNPARVAETVWQVGQQVLSGHLQCAA